MERQRIIGRLEDQGYCRRTLESGVRISAHVSSGGSSSPGSGNGPGSGKGIIIQATCDGTCLRSERHSSYEDAAARYVELVDDYCEKSAPPAHEVD
jgi:hypothetical protein